MFNTNLIITHDTIMQASIFIVPTQTTNKPTPHMVNANLTMTQVLMQASIFIVPKQPPPPH